MIFHRIQPDGFKVSADSLVGQYGCAGGSACVIALGGPSGGEVLGEMQDHGGDGLLFAVNNGFDTAEGGLFRADIWTSYDNPIRFDRSLLLNPSVLKICPSNRKHEVIAGGDRVLADCPNVVFFDPQEKTNPGSLFGCGPVIDSRDSMLQAIDIAIRLGFKDIHLAGANLYTPLNSQQVDKINEWLTDLGSNIPFKLADTLNSLYETLGAIAHNRGYPGVQPPDLTESQKADVQRVVEQLAEELSQMDTPEMYCFGSAKTALMDRVRSDHHYKTTASRLVASRRCLDSLGVRLYHLKPRAGCLSRLDGFFPVSTVDDLPVYEHTEPDYTQAGRYLVKPSVEYKP